MGTGVEQGRVAKVNAGALTAEATGRPRPEIGVSSARPPTEPVLFHALAGRAKGSLYEPVRTTPIQPSHEAQGAVFERVGQWLRPRYFPKPGETMADGTERECRAVRDRVGMMDVSTLGKIDVQGPDAAIFLDRLYLNTMSTLEPGKARYGLMCRSDGTVLDDGVVIRLDHHRFFVTTTTGNAATVLDWMEEWLQTEWTELAVWVGSITEQWATVAVVGPESRAVLSRLAPDLDLANQAFPFMTVRRAPVAPATVWWRGFGGGLVWALSPNAKRGRCRGGAPAREDRDPISRAGARV